MPLELDFEPPDEEERLPLDALPEEDRLPPDERLTDDRLRELEPVEPALAEDEREVELVLRLVLGEAPARFDAE